MGTVMVVLENSVDIARPPEQVFDYLSDLRNKKEWNPKMRSVLLLTGEPIGRGTKYRARWAGSPDNVVEYTAFDRPHEWASVADSKMMVVRFSARVTPVATGSRLDVRMELVPHGPLRLLQPLLHRWMQAQEVDNMRSIKTTMESLAAR
ncbi:SRPBCC family protein [Nonomuraea polychroma]|uniref:SRPBCC family protein n=1 Tax=Nonomuraea polychroma TaxID=46176 RepID=UPI003D8CDB93